MLACGATAAPFSLQRHQPSQPNGHHGLDVDLGADDLDLDLGPLVGELCSAELRVCRVQSRERPRDDARAWGRSNNSCFSAHHNQHNTQNNTQNTTRNRHSTPTAQQPRSASAAQRLEQRLYPPRHLVCACVQLLPLSGSR